MVCSLGLLHDLLYFLSVCVCSCFSRSCRFPIFLSRALLWGCLLGGVQLVLILVPQTPLLRTVEAVAVVLLARASFLPPMLVFQRGL
jgi:hypothetical protein